MLPCIFYFNIKEPSFYFLQKALGNFRLPLLCAMNSQVIFERLFIPKAFATLGALVGPLPRVDPLMFQKMMLPNEALPAHRTLVGSLSCVQSLVVQKMLLPHEAFPTVCAFIGPLPRVNHLMPDES